MINPVKQILVSLHIQGSFFKHIFVKYCKDFSFDSEKSVPKNIYPFYCINYHRQSFPSQQELDADSSEAPYSARDNKSAHYLRSARNNTSNQTPEQFFNLEDDSLDTNLIFDIMKKFFSGSSSLEIAKQIMNIKCLRESLWALFMLEVEESAKYIACKRNSCLGLVTYDHLKCFEWENIIEEIYIYQPRLLQVLITISTGENKLQDECHYKSAAKEIGLIYGILMKRRCHTLSQVQRVIALAIAQENVHQKVNETNSKIVLCLGLFLGTTC